MPLPARPPSPHHRCFLSACTIVDGMRAAQFPANVQRLTDAVNSTFRCLCEFHIPLARCSPRFQIDCHCLPPHMLHRNFQSHDRRINSRLCPLSQHFLSIFFCKKYRPITNTVSLQRRPWTPSLSILTLFQSKTTKMRVSSILAFAAGAVALPLVARQATDAAGTV